MAIEKVGFVHLTFDSFCHPWIMYGIRMKLQKEKILKNPWLQEYLALAFT